MMTTDFTLFFKTITDSVGNYLLMVLLILMVYSMIYNLIKHISNCIVTVVLACRAPITTKNSDENL